MGVRLAIALVLLAFTPAFAQDADAPATLRPSVQADGPTPAPTTPNATPATPTTPSPPVAPAFSPIPPQATAEQCRMRCAQDYYFCLAENEISDCAPTWGQCRLACNKTATTTPAR